VDTFLDALAIGAGIVGLAVLVGWFLTLWK